MRTRTQEAAYIDHIEDEPETGPDLYVALDGFNQPGLLRELCRLRSGVQAVLSMASVDDTEGAAVEDPALGSKGYVIQVGIAQSSLAFKECDGRMLRCSNQRSKIWPLYQQLDLSVAVHPKTAPCMI
jgi:hypothetical protein